MAINASTAPAKSIGATTPKESNAPCAGEATSQPQGTSQASSSSEKEGGGAGKGADEDPGAIYEADDPYADIRLACYLYSIR